MAIALLQKDFSRIIGRSESTHLNKQVFGDKVGLFASLFGCWHKRITRSFTESKTCYRACLECGARKPFNPETLETERRFYYPPIVKKMRIE